MQKKKKRWPKILGITLLVIVVVLAAAALGGYLYLRNRFGTGTAEVHLTADGNTVVSVTGGDLTGGTEDGVYSFLGVPYATAPSGLPRRRRRTGTVHSKRSPTDRSLRSSPCSGDLTDRTTTV